MILLLILLEYYEDVKEYGKENLAVSLSRRLITYFIYVGIPVAIAILKSLEILKCLSW